MRILVIEDEPRILGFLKVGLEAEGFTVDGAADGVEGYALARCQRTLPRRNRLTIASSTTAPSSDINRPLRLKLP